MEPQAEPRAEEARGRLANRTSEAGASGRSCAVRFRASTTTRLEHTRSPARSFAPAGAPAPWVRPPRRWPAPRPAWYNKAMREPCGAKFGLRISYDLPLSMSISERSLVCRKGL